MNTEIQVSIFHKAVSEKPPKHERGQLFNQVRRSKRRSLTPMEFAKTITEWKRPFCHATFKDDTNCYANFLQSQLLVLDFDNDKGQHISPRDILGKCDEIGIARPFFIGSTLSDTTDKNLEMEKKLEIVERYRVMFLLTEPITDLETYKWIYNKGIRQLFPQNDPECQAAQMWFPCRDILYLNTENRMDILRMMSSVELHQVSDKIPGTARRHLKRKYKKAPPTLFKGWREGGNLNNVQKTTNSYSNIKEHVGNRTNLIRDFNWDLGCEECDLLNRFLKMEGYISHDELFLLYSSMRKIMGGRKLWKKCIEGNTEIANRKLDIALWFNAVDSGNEWYDFPFSKYAPDEIAGEKYNSLLDIYFLKRGSPAFKHSSLPEISLDSAEKKMYTSIATAINGHENISNFHDAIAVAEDVHENTSHFHAIKATTGIGKTKTALEFLKEGIVIAVPTHELKWELYERAKRNNINVSVMPEEPKLCDGLKNELERIRSTGDFNKAAGLLQLIRNNIGRVQYYDSDLGLNDLKKLKQKLDKYFSNIDKCLCSSKPLITTHNMLLFTEFPNHDTVIIDEDIIPTLMKTKCVYEKDLRLLRSELKSSDDIRSNELFKVLNNLYKNVNNCKVGRTYNNIYKLDDELYKLLRNVVFKLRHKINGAPLLLLTCNDFIVELQDREDIEGERIVYFYDKKKLSEDKKYILISATANRMMYEKLFNYVTWTDISNVEHTGKRIQYSDLSHSRSTIGSKNNKWVIDAINTHFDNTPVITFQKYRGLFNKPSKYYFGNLLGYDSLKGRDIVVIGTDHMPEYVYKLMAAELGIECSDEDFELKDQWVDHNGYKFYFKTYSNPELRAIQFYYIESSLTQACGRNRTLREDATCYLFSNYPLPWFDQMSAKELIAG